MAACSSRPQGKGGDDEWIMPSGLTRFGSVRLVESLFRSMSIPVHTYSQEISEYLRIMIANALNKRLYVGEVLGMHVGGGYGQTQNRPNNVRSS